jgi:hypothetical protein
MTNTLTFLQCFETHKEAKEWTTKIQHPVLIIHLVKDNLNLFTVVSKEDMEALYCAHPM